MEWKKLKEEAKEFALKKIDVIDYDNHERKIMEYIRDLAPKYGGNSNLLEVATYLHDLGWFEDENNHAKASANIAATFLKEQGPDQDTISEIEYVIESHEATGGLENINARILRAADGLAIINNIPYLFFLSWNKDKLNMSYEEGLGNFAGPMITSALEKVDGLDSKLVDPILREYIQKYIRGE
ncbi:MAG: HD domain-containing protein [Nanoarchaeota archaeon]